MLIRVLLKAEIKLRSIRMRNVSRTPASLKLEEVLRPMANSNLRCRILVLSLPGRKLLDRPGSKLCKNVQIKPIIRGSVRGLN